MNIVNQILKNMKWDQNDLATYLECGQSTISRWVVGHTPIPGAAKLAITALQERLDRGEYIPKPSRQRDAPHEPDIIT